MRSAYVVDMRVDHAANILGALVQALSDDVGTAIAGPADRSATDAAALVHLSKYRGASIDALRAPLRLSHPGCVRLVDRLEGERLVARGEAEDGRSCALALTRAGRAAARSVLDSRLGALRRALAALSPGERQSFAALVGKVLGSLVLDEAHALAVCRVCDYDACPDSVCPVARALGG
jgi:DNA-binding MarR family transcriptional regulator